MECTDDKIVMTDAMIRNKAREISRNLGWPEERFKASSGWVENFKHRHGIRKGIWHGNGTNTLAARALGCARRYPSEAYDNISSCLDGLPPLPPLPGYDDPPPVAGTSQHVGHVIQVEPSEEVAHQIYHVRRHPVWQSPDQSGDGGRHPIDSHRVAGNRDDVPLAQPAVSDPHRPPPMTTPPPVPIPMNPNSGEGEGEPEVAYIVPALPTYRPVIAHVPTIAEAEDAIDKVIAFVKAQEKDFLKYAEHEALRQVKCALFQLASGLPFNRE